MADGLTEDDLSLIHIAARRREHAVKSYNIGVLIAEHWLDKYVSFYLQMYQQVATRAVAKECFTLMEVVSAQMETACEMPKLVQEQKADGLIIIGRLTGEYLKFLNEKAKIPLLYMDFCDEKTDTDAVISDSYYGAYRMTNYLFDMGHREIAYVGTCLLYTSQSPSPDASGTAPNPARSSPAQTRCRTLIRSHSPDRPAVLIHP